MKLSLAGWSLAKMFFDKQLTLLDFPQFTKSTFGLSAVELNSPFFESHDSQYLSKLVSAADRAGVTMLNIAVDEKGDLASEDEAERKLGIESYSKWVPIAKEIGVNAIRANSGGQKIKDRDAAVRLCTDSFRRLADVGKKHDVTILMENHGGLSSDPASMIAVMEGVAQTHGKAAIGTLPDFGNWPDEEDRYAALRQIMPWARAVHAKVLEIDENLNHPKYDLGQCLEIARESGYDGYLGIESEGGGAMVQSVERAVRKLTPML